MMQKKIIALVVAGLVSGGAFAQSNVTVFGVMDLYTGGAKAGNVSGDQKQTFVNAGGLAGSRLGFMGEENLGDGLKGIFKLELGSLTLDGATNSIGSTRESFVGLKSDKLGQVHLGRVQTVGYYWAQKYDPLTNSPAFSLLMTAGRASGGQTQLNWGSARQDNAITYISPSLEGLVISANYAVGEQVTGTTGAAGYKAAQTFYNVGADYEKGPLAIGAVYAQITDRGGTLNNVIPLGVKDWSFGAKYDLGFIKPIATYQEATDRTNTKAEAWRNKLWSAGVHIPVFEADTIKLAYMNFKNDQANAVKANGYAAVYMHAFSKRTTVYAGYQYIHNGTYAVFTPGASDAVTSAGKNASSFGLGMRHDF